MSARIAKKPAMMAFRVSEEDLAQIKARATEHGLTATEYVTQCALGTLADPSEVDDRIAELERKVERLERLAELEA